MKFQVALWSSLGVAATLAGRFDPNSYADEDVITRDVVVIGGGATGTYAAINLLDLGVSVALVEKQSDLGGHTNTYTVPDSGVTIDYGVQTYSNNSAVRDFLARFEIPTTPFSFQSGEMVYADFETGEAFPDYEPSFDFTAYTTQLQRFPYLTTSWTLPDPVPEDLLLSFGEFLNKYNLGDIAYAIWSNSWGSGDALSQPTVYMLKAIDESFIRGLAEGTVTTARRNNHELYEKALAELGSSALVSSTVTTVQRPSRGSTGDSVELVVQTPNGEKLVVASKIIVSAPPNIENMAVFDLDNQEKGVFQKFTNSALYVSLITDTGLPNGYAFRNVRPGSADTFAIPPLPGLYLINPTAVDGMFVAWYGAPNALPEADVKAHISATIAHLRETIADGSSAEPTEMRFLAYDSHTPFQLAVPSDAIADGFYRDLEGLQGNRRTWYTGAAFLSHHAGELWNFTRELLPRVVSA
ncbi:hypothetical protein AJ79_03380 [Helicocarpus griseus UAMH5409]|uniref:Amine oxidase domain-containing protein n=1 Tax=Helicocarpus griseus UAMH5409 TaxID=1447875 RepID=A0A2B7XYV7_9EURO|nr:hypothetical protein AJ79_03380 [Helicocarpus griseus UAMH5409]